MRFLRVSVVAFAAVAACGDYRGDANPLSPGAGPPGSTTTAGSVSASISGVQFSGRLATPASVTNDRLTFSAYDGTSRQLSISVNASGPGTFDAGSPADPVLTLVEESGGEQRRWVSPSTAGFGSITLTFLSDNAAVGHFFFIGLPDSATVLAGITTRRSVTAGAFNIAIAR